MAKKKITPGHWHEATDRTLCVMDIVESMLQVHPAIVFTPALKNKVQKVQDLLGDIYQIAGAKM